MTPNSGRRQAQRIGPLPLRKFAGMTPHEERRFHRFVNVRGADECWPWMGVVSRGYGLFRLKREGRWIAVRAHRVAFFLQHGEEPIVCRHACDNSPCCNPSHLLNGDHSLNRMDCIQRGRHARGSRHGSTQLHEHHVETMRRIYAGGVMKQREVGALFGIGQTQVSHIVRHVQWESVQFARAAA